MMEANVSYFEQNLIGSVITWAAPVQDYWRAKSA